MQRIITFKDNNKEVVCYVSNLTTERVSHGKYHVEFVPFKTKVVEEGKTTYFIQEDNEFVETTEEEWNKVTCLTMD